MVLRRGWLPVVLGVIVGIAAGLLARSEVTTKYTATASVDVAATGVQPTLVGSRTPNDVINMDTEVQLVTSDGVATRVQQIDPATRHMSIATLVSNVTVTVAANTEVLDIGYESTNARLSARFANDFASAYLQQRQAAAQALLSAQLSSIAPQATALSKQLQSDSQQLANMKGNDPHKPFLRAQVASEKSRLDSLTRRISDLQTTSIFPGKISVHASAGKAQQSPSRILFVGAGAAAGLLLGLLGAWLRVTVRRRLRTPNDVRAVLDLPVLATVRADNGQAKAGSSSFEDYRRVANVVVSAGGDHAKTILVTGQNWAATSAVASNLLRALALSSTHTALVRTSRESMATSGMDRIVRDALVPSPRNGMLSAADLAEARGSGYLIAVASDPRASADAQTTARFSDSVVIVLETGTRTRVAKAILEELDTVGAPILGVVLVRRARLGQKKQSNNGSTEDSAPESGTGTPAAKGHSRKGRAEPARPASTRSAARRTTPSTASRPKK